MIKKILKTEFNRNVLTLLTGTTLAQAIPFLIAPVLTRLFLPEDFGILAAFVAVFTVLSTFVTLKYEQVIILPKNDKEAFTLLSLTVGIVVLLSIVFFGVFLIFQTEINQLFDSSEMGSILLLVPLSLLFFGIYRAFYYWFNRRKMYRSISGNTILRSTGISGSKIAFGFLKTPGGLVLGTILGQFLAAFFFVIISIKDILIFSKDLSFSGIKTQAKKYSQLVLTLISSLGIQNVYTQIPIFFIGRFFGMGILGFVSIAQRLVTTPVSIIANAIGDVFRQQATDEFNEKGRFDNIFKSTLKKTFLISIIPFVLIYIFAPDFFAFWLGDQWRIAGEYAQIIIIGKFFSFIFTPVDKASLIRQKKSYILLWNVSRFVANCAIVAIAILFNTSVEIYLWMLVSIRTIHYFIDGVFCYRFSLGK